MPRRHITCQWNRQAVRLIRNKCSAARPRGLTSGSARWLTSRTVGHVAASGLRLGGEQKRTWYGPDTCRLRTPAWSWLRSGYSLSQNPGTLLWVARTYTEGFGTHPGVRFAHVEALNLTRRSGPFIQGSGTFPWGSEPTTDTLEDIVFSSHVAAPELSAWWGRAMFATRLEIAAWTPRLHTVVRGTPISVYRQSSFQRDILWIVIIVLLNGTYVQMYK
jgi:hypothetical protein